jgi:hypothetical protein
MRPTLPIHSQGLWRTAAVPEFGCSGRSPVGAGLLTMAIFHAARHSTLTLLTVGRDVAPSDLGASGRPVLPSPGAGARRRAGGRGDPAAYRGPFAAGADWPRPDRLSRLGEKRDDVAKEAPEGVEGLGGSSSVDDVRRCARNHPATRDRRSHSRGPGCGTGVEADRGVDREKLGSRLTIDS